jgi:hypothetical protein
MRRLAPFLGNRKSEQTAANFANSQSRRRQNSQLSRLSQAAGLKTKIPAGRKFAEFATFATPLPENQSCEREAKASVQSRSTHPPPAPEVAPAENERRRGRWREPVEGRSKGRMTIRSIDSGETTVIYLATKRGRA